MKLRTSYCYVIYDTNQLYVNCISMEWKYILMGSHFNTQLSHKKCINAGFQLLLTGRNLTIHAATEREFLVTSGTSCRGVPGRPEFGPLWGCSWLAHVRDTTCRTGINRACRTGIDRVQACRRDGMSSHSASPWADSSLAYGNQQRARQCGISNWLAHSQPTPYCLKNARLNNINY